MLDLQGFVYSSGELGIRTPGPVTVNSFQDCRNRPLCQLSGDKSTNPDRIDKLDVNFFLINCNHLIVIALLAIWVGFFIAEGVKSGFYDANVALRKVNTGI
jgi:uncharacterized protein involved in tellurium resistance